MMKNFADFLSEVGGYSTSRITFRPQTPFTNAFGLVRRYRATPDSESEWGWPGIHFGVDRAVGESGDRSIFAPVSGVSRFEDWQNQVYGSLIFLHHWGDFEVVIAHCDPDEVSPNVLSGEHINAGELLAHAGNYGFSFGVHTHTEIRAPGDSNDLLDEFLERKVGSDAFKELSTDEIILAYAKCERTERWGTDQVMADYHKLRDEKRIVQMNKYRMVRRIDLNVRRTYYSSKLVLDF